MPDRAPHHGPIEKISENLWRVVGPVPGLPMKRVMTLVRRDDGGVVIHSPIALEPAAFAEVEAWGSPRVVIVPSRYHRIDAPSFAARYPGIDVTCPPGARAAVEKVVPVTYTYESFKADGTLRIETLDGTKGGEGVMIVRSSDGTTLVFNDALFNMPHIGGVHGFVLKYVTQSSGGPRVTRLARLAILRDKVQVRAHFQRLAGLPGLVRIIVAHHDMIIDAPGDTLRRVAGTLS
jgi:hypothetical protein